MIFFGEMPYGICKDENFILLICEKKGKNYGKYYNYYYISGGFAY